VPLSSPEAKAALKIAIAEAVAATKAEADEAAAALQANNAKLVGQLREARKNLEIDPAKYAALEDTVADLNTKLVAATKEAQKTAKESATQLEALTKQLASESGFTQKLLVDNGLTDALVKAGVAAHYLPAAKAMLAGQAKIVTEGDVRKAMMGDKSLVDHVSAWAASDEGKHFVAAPQNSGAGASGNASNGGSGVKTLIQAGDKKAFGANLAELAKGTAGTVQIAP